MPNVLLPFYGDVLQNINLWIGSVGDVLGILMRHVPLEGLDEKEQIKSAALRIQLAEIDRMKAQRAACAQTACRSAPTAEDSRAPRRHAGDAGMCSGRRLRASSGPQRETGPSDRPRRRRSTCSARERCPFRGRWRQR